MKKRLGEHADDAIHLAAVRRADALGHFLLKHASHFGYPLPVLNHLKYNLGADVVRKITRNRHLLFAEVSWIDLQKIADKIGAVVAFFGNQVVDALLVYLRQNELILLLFEVLGEHARARSHLNHRLVLAIAREGVGNALGSVVVG